MRVRFVHAVLLVWILCPVTIPADEHEPSAPGWSIIAQNDNRSQTINWSSKEQQKQCNGYLEDLRSQFLKTRHYAIQGASCNTAANAAAFLKSMETCKQNCPQGLLGHNGYTERIIRNIEYLGKLGNDRCNDSPTPVPHGTQTP